MIKKSKYLFLFWVLLACCIISCAGELSGSQGFEEESNADSYSITIAIDDLPLGIQNYITNNFPDSEISLIKRHTRNGNISYEIILKNGEKLLFSPNGLLLAIDRVSTDNVPDEDGEEVFASSLPAQIIQYILDNYPNTTIVYSEKENDGNFEVNLDNGLELHFDSDGNFLNLDNDNDDDGLGNSEEDDDDDNGSDDDDDDEGEDDDG